MASPNADPEAEGLPTIKLLILDVDGVLTDGTLPYDAQGSEVKVFHVQDGGAIRRWQASGGVAAIVSGRSSPAVSARAKELGVTLVEQGVADKRPAYEAFCRAAGVGDEEVAFVGDDLLDLPPLRRCGYPIAVANAAPAVKRASKYVTRRPGGRGAVAEIVERLMRHNGTWSSAAGPENR